MEKEPKIGKIPELKKFDYTKEGGEKGEGEILLSEDEVKEHLGEGEKIETQVMSDGKERTVLSGMSVRRAKELMDAMGAKPATVEDLLEAFGVTPNEAHKRIEEIKKLESSDNKKE